MRVSLPQQGGGGILRSAAADDTRNLQMKEISAAFAEAQSDDNCWAILRAHADMAILSITLGTEDGTATLHHVTQLGSRLLRKPLVDVALIGLEDKATPVTISKTGLVNIEDIQCPKLTYLQDLKSDTDILKKLPNGTATDEVPIFNCILLMPWAVDAIKKAGAVYPGQILLALIDFAAAWPPCLPKSRLTRTPQPMTWAPP